MLELRAMPQRKHKPQFKGAFYVSELEALFPPVHRPICPYCQEIQAACRKVLRQHRIAVTLPFSLGADQWRELRGKIEDVELERGWRFSVALNGCELTIYRRI